MNFEIDYGHGLMSGHRDEQLPIAYSLSSHISYHNRSLVITCWWSWNISYRNIRPWADEQHRAKQLQRKVPKKKMPCSTKDAKMPAGSPTHPLGTGPHSPQQARHPQRTLLSLQVMASHLWLQRHGLCSSTAGPYTAAMILRMHIGVRWTYHAIGAGSPCRSIAYLLAGYWIFGYESHILVVVVAAAAAVVLVVDQSSEVLLVVVKKKMVVAEKKMCTWALSCAMKYNYDGIIPNMFRGWESHGPC